MLYALNHLHALLRPIAVMAPSRSTTRGQASIAQRSVAFWQVRVSNELRKRGICISPSCTLSVWLRHNLESFKKRLTALERHIAQTGEAKTEA